MLNIFDRIFGGATEQHDEDKKVNPFPNGPVVYKTRTNGQVRRARVRAQATRQRKQVQAARRKHFADKREASVLRAHLQNLAVMPRHDGYSLPSDISRFARSLNWVVGNFASGSVEENLVSAGATAKAIQAAYDRYRDLVGQPHRPISETGWKSL